MGFVARPRRVGASWVALALVGCAHATTFVLPTTHAPPNAPAAGMAPSAAIEAAAATHYPPPTCTQVPEPRFTAESWVAPVGLDPAVEQELRAIIFGTLNDPREGPLREVMAWGVDPSEREGFPTRNLDPVAIAAIARVRELPGERPIGIDGSGVSALESVGPVVDIVRACRAAVALGSETSSEMLVRDAFDDPARYAIRARCPGYSAVAELALVGEVSLAHAVVRLIPERTGLDRAAGQWSAANYEINRAIGAFIMGDLCLARFFLRRASTDWTTFQASAYVQDVCQQPSDCDVEARAARLAIGIERRATRSVVSARVQIPESGPVAPDLIPALVAALDDVRIWSDQGGWLWRSEPLFRALDRAGDAAVPALIAILEEPDRLTLSPIISRMNTLEDLVSVHSLVTELLRHTLAMPDEYALDPRPVLGASPNDAATFRHWFAQVRGMTRVERCFHTLRASRDVESWRAAASCLTVDPPRNGTDARVSLRLRRSPSVTQVMSSRALDALRLQRADEACDLARSTIEWAPTETRAWLVRFDTRCRTTPDCFCTQLLGRDVYASTPATRALMLDLAEVEGEDAAWLVVALHPREEASRRFIDRAARSHGFELYARAIVNPRFFEIVPGLRERALAALADTRPFNVCQDPDNCGTAPADAQRNCDEVGWRVERAGRDEPDNAWSDFSNRSSVAERDVRIARMIAHVGGEGATH